MRPKFSSLLRQVSKVLKFAQKCINLQKNYQILKFHERVISALILVVSFARSKISSQFLRLNEILKFTQ